MNPSNNISIKTISKLHSFHVLNIGLLILVTCCIYFQTVKFDITYHDDDLMLVDGRPVLARFNIKELLTTDAWLTKKKIELYRPLQSITYAVDYKLGDGKPSVFHLHNLIVFCLLLIAQYFFFISVRLPQKHSLGLSLLTAAHFTVVHAVCWIPARGDLYLALFSFLFMVFWLEYLKSKNLFFYFSSVILLLLAIFSKETGMVLIPVAWILHYLFNKNDFTAARLFFRTIPFVFCVALFLYLRAQSVSTDDSTLSFNAILYNIRSIPEEVFKFFIPVAFSVMPKYNWVVTWSGSIIILCLLLIAFKNFTANNKKFFLLGFFLFILPFFPTLIYKPAFTEFAYDYLDHRVLVPFTGMFLIVYTLILPYLTNKIAVYVYAIVFIVISLLSFNQAAVYRDMNSYYDNATQTSPTSGLAWLNYGTLLGRQGKFEKAIGKFDTLIQLYPDSATYRIWRLQVYWDLKSYKPMVEECKKIIQTHPALYQPYEFLNRYYIESKQPDSALFFNDIAIKNFPAMASIYFYRGLSFSQLSNLNEAINAFNICLQKDSFFSRAYFERGNAYGALGNFNSALNDFVAYVKLNPNDGQGIYGRGQAYCLCGQNEKGCKDLQMALQMGVKDAELKITQFCK